MCDLCGKRFKYGPIYAATVDGKTYIYHPTCGYLLPDEHNVHNRVEELKFEMYGDAPISRMRAEERLQAQIFDKINEMIKVINYLLEKTK